MAQWTRLPEAARLLASCAADPPPLRPFAFRFQEIDLRFVGGRARRLRRLYRAAQPQIDTPAWREWLALDPQRAIAGAIRQHQRVATHQPDSPGSPIPRRAAPAPTLSTATAG